jgi:KDO2-lipid IV(A) lauroyltransferase
MNVFLYLIFISLEKVVPLFPLKFWYLVARIYAVVFYYFIPIRKKTAVDNLKLTFPEKSSKQISKIVRGVYRNVFIVIFEFFYMPKFDLEELRKMIKITNLELINEKLKTGKGLVIISAHFANWELMAYGVSQLCGEPFNVIIKEQTNKLIDKRINKLRESKGNRMIDMNRAARDVLGLLRNNKIVALLGDQSAPKESSVKVDFFVKNVPAFEGAARFAIKTGAGVVFSVPYRNEDYSYTVTLNEINMSRYIEYTEDNIKKLTEEHTNMLANYIRKYPDHWLWFHRRFKHVRQD